MTLFLSSYFALLAGTNTLTYIVKSWMPIGHLIGWPYLRKLIKRLKKSNKMYISCKKVWGDSSGDQARGPDQKDLARDHCATEPVGYTCDKSLLQNTTIYHYWKGTWHFISIWKQRMWQRNCDECLNYSLVSSILVYFRSEFTSSQDSWSFARCMVFPLYTVAIKLPKAVVDHKDLIFIMLDCD